MKCLKFEWDENKAKSNIEKHQVSFEEAETVFYDESALVIADPDNSKEKERFVIMGWSIKASLLVVCHCYRQNDGVIRIISARKATKTESGYYKG